VVQAVAALVEEGQDLGMGQQRGLISHGRGEVTHQVGAGDLIAGGGVEPVDADIHPGPAALVGTGERVEIELAPQVAIARADLEEAHLRMPGLDPLDLADADVEEPLQQLEEAAEDPADGEIGPQFLWVMA
jgi:hypothetical protein